MRFRSVAAIAAFCCSASPLLAQGLTRIQLLALQQQLRDDGCGVSHVTGRMDAMTRRAVKNCMSKYNVTSGGAAELLAAMNIGFGPNDQQPSMGGVGGVTPTAMPSDTTGGRRMRHMRPQPGRRMRRREHMPSDTTRMRDTTGMQHADTMHPPGDTSQKNP